MSNKVEPVELCVILPYQDFVSMDKRAKKERQLIRHQVLILKKHPQPLKI